MQEGGGWEGVSPKALSLMPAQPLGEGGNSVMLPEFEAGRNIKERHTWSRDFRLPLPFVSRPFPCRPFGPGDSPMTSVLLSIPNRNRLRFLACAGSDTRQRAVIGTRKTPDRDWQSGEKKNRIDTFANDYFVLLFYALYFFYIAQYFYIYLFVSPLASLFE